MNWLKENWFKIGILAILLLSVSVYYQYLETRVSQQERVILSSNKEKCANEVDNLRNRIPDVRRDFELIEAHFNKDMGTCYAYVLDSSSETSFYIVYDVLSASEVFIVATSFDDGWKYYSSYEINSIEDIDEMAHELMYKKLE